MNLFEALAHDRPKPKLRPASQKFIADCTRKARAGNPAAVTLLRIQANRGDTGCRDAVAMLRREAGLATDDTPPPPTPSPAPPVRTPARASTAAPKPASRPIVPQVVSCTVAEWSAMSQADQRTWLQAGGIVEGATGRVRASIAFAKQLLRTNGRRTIPK